MAKTKLPKLCFTQSDFQAADRLGKFYMKLMQPYDFELSNRDDLYFQKMRWAYPLLAEGKPRQFILRALCDIECGIWANQAEGIIKDTEKLYANFGKVNRQFLRATHREKMLTLAQMIEENFFKKKEVEGEDMNGKMIAEEIFVHNSAVVLSAVEQVRKLWADVAKYEQLDKEDKEIDNAGALPEVSFDDTNMIELAEYEYLSEDSIHEPTQTLPSQKME
jgi:hypothetical protein